MSVTGSVQPVRWLAWQDQDITDRLRYPQVYSSETFRLMVPQTLFDMREAADEIERLRAETGKLWLCAEENNRLRAEIEKLRR
jgi:hypothetical protein